jgi:hypothetical protein
MNWDAVGAIGEIVGAMAVFASLFYVGLQVRQNSKAVRGQTFESLSTTLSDLAMQAANDPQMTDLLVKAVAGEELTSHEDTRFVALIRANMRVASAVYYQYSLDLLDAAQLKDLTFSASALLSTPSGKRVWEVSKVHLAEDFVSYMDETLNTSLVGKVAVIYGQNRGDNA